MTNISFRKNHVKTEDAYRIFFDELSFHSPARLVKTASKFFGLPVMLTNEHYQLISMFPSQPLGVDVYDDLLREHILSPELIHDYQMEYLTSSERYYDPFYANHSYVSTCPRIFGEVYSPGRIYGHFAIMMFDNPLEEEDIACARIFQQALKIVMSSSELSSNATYSGYLKDLLDPGRSSSLKSFAKNELVKYVKGKYALLVTPIGSDASAHAYAMMQTAKISDTFYSVVATVYRDKLVTLCGSLSSADAYTEEELSFLKRTAVHLKSIGRSGLSLPFEDLMDVSRYYQEAKLAVRSSQQELCLFSELMLPAMYQAMCHKTDPEIFILPVIHTMEQYDLQNNTEYLNTLIVYLRCFQQKDQTADTLHIHRNSLSYRLGKIRDLFGVNLSDPQYCLLLLIGFYFREMNEEKEQDCISCIND